MRYIKRNPISKIYVVLIDLSPSFASLEISSIGTPKFIVLMYSIMLLQRLMKWNFLENFITKPKTFNTLLYVIRICRWLRIEVFSKFKAKIINNLIIPRYKVASCIVSPVINRIGKVYISLFCI